MATRAEWQKIRDEVAASTDLITGVYRRGERFCGVGWLCRDALKDVPNDCGNGLLLIEPGFNDTGIKGVMTSRRPETSARHAVRERLRVLGLTADEAEVLQSVNDRAYADERVTRVLAYLDQKIAEAPDGDEG